MANFSKGNARIQPIPRLTVQRPVKVCSPPLVFDPKKGKCKLVLNLDIIGGFRGLGNQEYSKVKPVVALGVLGILLFLTWPK